MEVQAPYLRCPQGHSGHRPFQELTGLRGWGKSLALQRALTDFGAEKSFGQASRQLWEHYGVELRPSSVREVVERQASRAAGLVDRESREALAEYHRQSSFRFGEPFQAGADCGVRWLHGAHWGIGARPGWGSESWGSAQASPADSMAGSAPQRGGGAREKGASIWRGAGFSPEGGRADAGAGLAVRLWG